MFRTIIERTIEAIGRDPDLPRVRRDVLDTIKRRWLNSLDIGSLVNDGTGKPKLSSDPTKVDKSKYLALLNPGHNVLTHSEPATLSDEEEFADEFGDAEFVYATEAGRKMAGSAEKSSGIKNVQSPVETLKAGDEPQTISQVLNEEILQDSLADPDYDAILEPSDCDVRIFGQTEICESVDGPRRCDSRWMITVLNGFLKRKDSNEETLFRTANQTFTHLNQI